MRLWQKGIVFGALTGFLLSLIQRDERQHVMDCSKQATSKMKQVYQHPSDSVKQLRMKLNDIMVNMDKFVQQLDQVERKIDERIEDKNGQ
ncbi:hypothetical protein [Alkalibacillus salilacus]|uniref:S-ribosylhomocysteine lyase LuxS involved in autoinducer biosynthesis n=1 Tax=Alkalibacillus salilacus TaxID=284582 RepID=A0ABT9VFP9_9BACI|nr:hypothetical protein [Alkalibacillus salilacus]MDQ0159802.1 S-ribosylhomocysteine lyase LuxS involved in autoinducer biosynthesis [Alkalibacillus salilacus]